MKNIIQLTAAAVTTGAALIIGADPASAGVSWY